MARFGFDSASFYNDLLSYLVGLVNEISQEVYQDIQNGMNNERAKQDVESDPAVIEGSTDYSGGSKSGYEFINARIWSYAFAVMDSYGTGINMDKSSPYLSQYKGSSLWNPARKGAQIVGRKKGSYTDIFGENAYSAGHYEGKAIPYSNNILPSRAIQRQEDWIMKDGETKIERRIKTFVDQFIAENVHKYFRSGD